MEIKRCEKGHFYDAEANSTCPQCAIEMGMGGFSMETTYGPGVDDYPPTEAAGDRVMNIGETVPVDGSGDRGVEEIEPTTPVNDFNSNPSNYRLTEGYVPQNPKPINGGNKVIDYDSVTQVAPINDKAPVGFSPVVGWLVCIEGPAKGTDYRIRAGYNTIGRSEHMDICICGDTLISKEKNAVIGYDYYEGQHMFSFERTGGKNTVRINGKMLMSETEINAYDVITIGKTKLLFVPLCGERFNWDE